MKSVKLNTDYEMPIIGLGTWKAEPGEVYAAVRWAIKLGYRHIDCAAIYGNEKEIGQALRDAVAEGDIKREELFITSKLWNDSHAAQDVIPALRQTLNDLQLDYLDLYLIHWPVAQKKGTTVPQADEDMLSLSRIPLPVTWAEMEKAKEQGLTRSVGVSNFGEKSLRLLINQTETVPAVNQIESHPLLPQSELLAFCRSNNIAVTAYSPLGSRGSQKTEAPNLLEHPKIKEIATRLHYTPAQVLLGWQLARGVIVIPKTIHEERLRENFAAQVVALDETDMAEIEKLATGHRFIDGLVFARGGYTSETIFA